MAVSLLLAFDEINRPLNGFITSFHSYVILNIKICTKIRPGRQRGLKHL
ncbi:MAG: hypothetical protein K8R75_09085 [Deltaproteobacteria bacterium]|nr:hypothetical protein [Deltaproteobacteria bacterium]